MPIAPDEPVRCARQGYDPHALEKEISEAWCAQEAFERMERAYDRSA